MASGLDAVVGVNVQLEIEVGAVIGAFGEIPADSIVAIHSFLICSPCVGIEGVLWYPYTNNVVNVAAIVEKFCWLAGTFVDIEVKSGGRWCAGGSHCSTFLLDPEGVVKGKEIVVHYNFECLEDGRGVDVGFAAEVLVGRKEFVEFL